MRRKSKKKNTEELEAIRKKMIVKKAKQIWDRSSEQWPQAILRAEKQLLTEGIIS